jgi:hypothetical protein
MPARATRLSCTRQVLAATLAASLLAVLIAPAAAPAADRVIRSRAGVITSVGPLRPSDAGVSRLTTLFGRPTAAVGRGNGCTVRFSAAHITVTLANFGGGGTACDAGHAQSATLDGRAWRTQRGLRVGDGISRMKRLYRQARVRNGRWELLSAPMFNTTVATLEAYVANGRVSRLRAYLGGAGE